MELIHQPDSFADACHIMNTIVLLRDAVAGIRFDLGGVSFPNEWMTASPFPGGN